MWLQVAAAGLVPCATTVATHVASHGVPLLCCDATLVGQQTGSSLTQCTGGCHCIYICNLGRHPTVVLLHKPSGTASRQQLGTVHEWLQCLFFSLHSRLVSHLPAGEYDSSCGI